MELSLAAAAGAHQTVFFFLLLLFIAAAAAAAAASVAFDLVVLLSLLQLMLLLAWPLPCIMQPTLQLQRLGPLGRRVSGASAVMILPAAVSSGVQTRRPAVCTLSYKNRFSVPTSCSSPLRRQLQRIRKPNQRQELRPQKTPSPYSSNTSSVSFQAGEPAVGTTAAACNDDDGDDIEKSHFLFVVNNVMALHITLRQGQVPRRDGTTPVI